MDADRVVFLTGCASGIGRRLSEKFHDLGDRLVLTDINLDGLEALAERAGWNRERVMTRRLDVRAASDWESAVRTTLDRWGRIDVLLNVAGYIKPGFVVETPTDQIELHLDINAKGVMLGTQIVGREMCARRGGHIVNVASMAGVAPVPGIALYTASKFAVRGFSLAVAHEFRKENVFVTVLCPDAVQTPMLDLQVGAEESALVFSGNRILTVDDIADTVFKKILIDKPLECIVPASRGRLAKLVNLIPQTAFFLQDRLVRRGLGRQAELKRS